jgi:cathepsin A (carboxypeptidase C)
MFQPVKVGYSYGQTNVKDTNESARDVYAFLQLFFAEYPQYATSPFHISGESYGGHYLPALSTEIIRNNAVAESKNLIKINYKSMLIGNGWTEPRTQFKGYAEFGCSNDSDYKPLFDQHTCDSMAQTYGRCKTLMDACYKTSTSLTCVPANLYCEKSQTGAYDKLGLNPYDIRKKCEGDTGLCYDLLQSIEDYANRKDVRANLGVNKDAGKFTGCNDGVGMRFYRTGDG